MIVGCEGILNDINISVIVPCYNVDLSCIEESINSILKQYYEKYEVLLIDDGSDKIYHDILEIIAKKSRK